MGTSPQGSTRLRRAARAGMIAFLVATLASKGLTATIYGSPTEFRESVTKAPVVVRGRLVAIVPQTYLDDKEIRTCGTNYVLKVTERYKGPEQLQIDFATFLSPSSFPYTRVALNQELFVLLESVPSDFDPQLRDVPDFRPGKPSIAKAECIRRLSRRRLSGQNRERAFVLMRPDQAGDDTPPVWLAYMRTYTTMPKGADLVDRPFDINCKPTGCESDARRRMS